MRERRLLERIAVRAADGMQGGQPDGESDGPQAEQARADMLIRSIVSHLHRLLNTRQGSAQIAPLFGLPDFTNVAAGFSAGSLHEIEMEICRMVAKYEPRLRSPKVSLRSELSDVLSIAFDLQGTLYIDDRVIAVRLATSVSANGEIRIV